MVRLQSVMFRVGFICIVFMAVVEILDGFLIAGGQTGLSNTNSSTSLARFNTLINNMANEVSTSVPDTSNPLEVGWSIATGIWSGIRLMFQLVPIMTLIFAETITGTVFFMPPWAFAMVELFTNLLMLCVVFYLAHLKLG